MKDIKKLFYKYKPKILVGVISLLLIILGILLFSSIIPAILVFLIDVIYYVPYLRNKAVIFMRRRQSAMKHCLNSTTIVESLILKVLHKQ